MPTWPNSRFRRANLPFSASRFTHELGYISIAKLVALSVELDLHFSLRTLAAIKYQLRR
jgi:hypothetical protein